MQLIFVRVITFIILTAVWVGISGPSDQLISIFAAPFVAFIIVWKLKLLPETNVFKITSVSYFFWLLKEIFMSSVAVVKIACRRNLQIHPVLEPIKSKQKTDIGIVTYANSITLTPGTVTVSTEGKVLLVHALDLKFMDDLQEGEMDNRISKIIK